MGKETALCKVRDDSACEQNGESRCFRVSLRQPQGQLCCSPSSSSSSLRRWQASPHLSLPGKASGSFGRSRLPGRSVPVAGAVGLCCGRGTVRLQQLVQQVVVRLSPFTGRRLSLSGEEIASLLSGS